MGWRRPWDGIDGRAFERYHREILRKKQGGVAEDGAAAAPDSGPKSVLKPETKDNAAEGSKADGAEDEDDADDDDAVASDDNSEVSDVSFDGYDDLVANMARGPLDAGQEDDDDEDDDEESAAIAEAARAAAMAALEAEEAERGRRLGRYQLRRR